MNRRPTRAHRRLLDVPDEDPLSGMANLFDTGMVFAVALMIALVSAYRIPQELAADGGAPALEVLAREGVLIERFRVSKDIRGGEGERLGTAYRLKSGEVVYVPEPEAGARRQ
jgi:hypothetical protein